MDKNSNRNKNKRNTGSNRKTRPLKRQFRGNQHERDEDTELTSTLAKKI